MKKNLKVALYDPYLDTLGGGEKFILSILKVFDEAGAKLDIFWNRNLTDEIKERFSIGFFSDINWVNTSEISSSLKSFSRLSGYDYFFYITDGSYFLSSAKKNYVYAMVPDPALYRMTAFNKIKLHNYRFITHSIFTGKWLKKFGIDAKIVPFYIDRDLTAVKPPVVNREKVILTVGRFFRHLHSKKQDTAIEFFKKLKKDNSVFSDYRLVLAGGLMKEDNKYFEKLRNLAAGDKSIVFKPNISREELCRLYRTSSYFWHLTGYGVDEQKNPEMVEHLGITPVEAMAGGCIVFCADAGGPREIITDGKNGFLFSSYKELYEKISNIAGNPLAAKKMREDAITAIKEKYTYDKFRENTAKILL